MSKEIAKLMLYDTAEMIRKLNSMGKELPLSLSNNCYEIVGKLWVLENKICEAYQVKAVDEDD